MPYFDYFAENRGILKAMETNLVLELLTRNYVTDKANLK